VLEPIDGYPESTVALRGFGTVTADDYREVLIPAVSRAAARGRNLRLLLEFSDGFEGYDAGAVRADAGVGIGHFSDFERIAVVTDHHGIRAAIHVFGIFIPGDVRLFDASSVNDARAWIRD
jgi:SpoIIAA-like